MEEILLDMDLIHLAKDKVSLLNFIFNCQEYFGNFIVIVNINIIIFVLQGIIGDIDP